MSVPKYHEFMKPLLIALSDNNEHKLRDLYSDLADYFNLNDSDRSELIPSGRQLLYHNRIGWAKTYLKKAGLIDTVSRATFKISEAGKAVLKDNPDFINQQFLMSFQGFKDFINTDNGSDTEITTDDDIDKTPQDELANAFIKIQKSLQDDLLTEVYSLTPDLFEKLVVDLVVAMGYGGTAKDAAQVVGKSGDEGIDGIIKADRLGFDQIYIQAKRWDPDKSIGRPEIQKFAGALIGKGASKGLFISTSSYTKEANEFVGKNLSQKIILIDGNMLTKLMVEHNIGVSIQEKIEIKSVDKDYFDNGI